MTTKTIVVPNISCGHCTHTIETELREIEGVTHVKAEQDSRVVIIEWQEPADWDKIEQTLIEIDYPPGDGAVDTERRAPIEFLD